MSSRAVSSAENVQTPVPMTYVIGRDGKVVDAWYGYERDRGPKVLKKLDLQ
jgi:peroxiredoxin